MPQLNADVDYTLTTKQLAALAGVNPGTINASLRRTGSYFGLLPMRLVNRRLMWPANDGFIQGRPPGFFIPVAARIGQRFRQ